MCHDGASGVKCFFTGVYGDSIHNGDESVQDKNPVEQDKFLLRRTDILEMIKWSD